MDPRRRVELRLAGLEHPQGFRHAGETNGSGREILTHLKTLCRRSPSHSVSPPWVAWDSNPDSVD